ncbi:hypothetical protein SESBI_14798 [Sesbania bispinosa]|nr:hypothetical protein SESBI_14798 [Sesbania bispinosa]
MRLPDGLRRRRRRTDAAEGWRWLHVVGAGLDTRDNNDGWTVCSAFRWPSVGKEVTGVWGG